MVQVKSFDYTLGLAACYPPNSWGAESMFQGSENPSINYQQNIHCGAVNSMGCL